MRITTAVIITPLCLFGFAAAAAPELDVLAGTTLGDDLGERPHAIDVDDAGNAVVAGDGTIVRLDAAGDPTGPLVRVGATIDDIAIDRTTGNVALVAGGRLLVLGPDLEWQWELAVEPTGAAPHRVAIGEHGTIAVANAEGLEILTPAGERLGRIASDDRVAAVAVLDSHDLVVAIGSSRCDVEGASLTAYSTEGAPAWRAWDERCESARAPSRGVDVARGEDGMIYVLAEVEGGRDPFATTPSIAFDDATDRARIESPLFAYYARFTPSGEHAGGQYLGFADALSIVEPVAIAADRHGRVHVVGTTTHSIAEPDEVLGEAEIVDALATPSGFYQVVAADLSRRLAWKQLDLDDGAAEIAALVIAGDRVLTLVHGAAADARGSTDLVAWPTVSEKAEKMPDRDDVGTFGYESGVAGADPTCYCDAGRPPSLGGWLALAGFGLVFGRKRRRG